MNHTRKREQMTNKQDGLNEPSKKQTRRTRNAMM